MTPQNVRAAIGPLRLVFWGGLICVLHLKLNGFDILNDVIGMLMITVGVCMLLALRVHNRYAVAMQFVTAVSVLAVLNAVRSQFSMDLPSLLILVSHAFSFVSLIAVVIFCIAMRWFCEEYHLDRAARSWQTTTWLFGVIYLVPLGLFHLACCVAVVTGKSFRIDFGLLILILLIVFAVPLIHLFVSTSRMARGVRDVSAPVDPEFPHSLQP